MDSEERFAIGEQALMSRREFAQLAEEMKVIGPVIFKDMTPCQ
jgi:hypothetical protein